jgi:hypothetical protein
MSGTAPRGTTIAVATPIPATIRELAFRLL